MAVNVRANPDLLLAEDIASYYADPLGFVMYAFPWDSDRNIQLVKLVEPWASRFGCEYGPDKWACEFLDELGAQVKDRGFDGSTAVAPIQFSTVSGHGIGKSTLTAWLILWIMSTRPHAKGVVTANTAEQLKTKTWAEVGKWLKICLTGHWFEYSSARGSMSLYHGRYKESWRCDAQTCREENSEAFAGLHAANSTPFYIFDEASAVPDKIFEVREGGTTDGEPMTFDFGNPTRNTGRFFEQCQGRFRHRYTARRIDSRDVAITNKRRLQEWVDDYGEDSDFVRVRVKGAFPRAGDMQFIPSDWVDTAAKRDVWDDKGAPLVIGVDVARFGDDETVIYPRLGRDARSFPAKRYRGLDVVQVSARVVEMVREFQALGRGCAGVFVDGGGVGGGVVDHLRALGHNVIEVNFGSSPVNGNDYRFKGDEMWGLMKAALKDWLCIPDDVDLKGDLTGREYGYTLKNQINLESKADMKKRGLASPDLADALALTFAHPVARRDNAQVQHVTEYDPMEV